MENFVNKVYKKLNPVIINWVDYNTSLRLGEDRKAYIRNKVILGIANNVVYIVLFLVFKLIVG